MCYGTVRIPSSVSWRLPSAVQAALAAILAAACSALPPSPRWLVNKRRYTEAYDAVDRLGLARGELELDATILSLSPSSTSSSINETTKETNRFAEVFTKPYWRQTVIGMFMMVMCQFSGIDGVLYVRKISRHSYPPHQKANISSMHRLYSGKPVSQAPPVAFWRLVLPVFLV